MKCQICSRDGREDAYCKLHKDAYQQVTNKYDLWRKALGVSWKEYLSEIAKNPLTGERAKEVAKQLIRLEKK